MDEYVVPTARFASVDGTGLSAARAPSPQPDPPLLAPNSEDDRDEKYDDDGKVAPVSAPTSSSSSSPVPPPSSTSSSSSFPLSFRSLSTNHSLSAERGPSQRAARGIENAEPADPSGTAVVAEHQRVKRRKRVEATTDDGDEKEEKKEKARTGPSRDLWKNKQASPGPYPKGVTNPRVVFFHCLSKQELSDMWYQLVVPRLFYWHRDWPGWPNPNSSASYMLLESLQGAVIRRGESQPDVHTHEGAWWLEKTQCCLWVPGAKNGVRPKELAPPPNRDNACVQIRNRPEWLTKEFFDNWNAAFSQDQEDGKVVQPAIKKILVHHIAWSLDRFPKERLPQELGPHGDVISHYCDTPHCARQSHLTCESHARNIRRQGCLGVELVVIGRTIVAERKCRHDLLGVDFSDSCARVHLTFPKCPQGEGPNQWVIKNLRGYIHSSVPARTATSMPPTRNPDPTYKPWEWTPRSSGAPAGSAEG